MPRAHQSLPRLHVAPALAAGARISLADEQAHYLRSVLRLRGGEPVIVFNGRDGAWMGSLVEQGKRGAALDLTVQTRHQTPKPDLWFGFAPLKSARLDYLVQKATEMGAGAIQPVLTGFTQTKNLRADKLRANIVEAAEQCEVLAVPDLLEEVALPELLAAWRDRHGLRRMLFCDEGAPPASPAGPLADLEGLPLGILIGPEGGFADEERAQLLAQSFVVPISLGPRILRADTAAVAAMAAVQAIIGDWR